MDTHIFESSDHIIKISNKTKAYCFRTHDITGYLALFNDLVLEVYTTACCVKIDFDNNADLLRISNEIENHLDQ